MMTANNADYTIHYSTDTIESSSTRSEYISEEDVGSLSEYLQYRKDVALMDDHPALQEAWEKYQVLLVLFREENGTVHKS